MKMRKALALTLSAAMTMGIAMPVMATDPEVDVTAPIYSFEVLNVVVPTKYEVAFNPEGLQVKTGDNTTSTDQILSRNYGMINKGNKDQTIKVALKVEDQNNGDDKVVFVDSADEVTNAGDNEYKIHLTAIPADATAVKVGSTPSDADKDTAAADLTNVTMTKADAAAVTLASGDNDIAFKLDKAVYSPKAGAEVTLGTTSSNDVKENYEITSLAADGAGITAFTFSGTMNAKANWSKLQNGIKITATYSNEIAPTTVETVQGTGAMIKVGPDNVVTSDGTNDIVIYYTGSQPASVTITPISITGTTKTAMTKSNGNEVVIDGEKVTLKAATFIAPLIKSSGRGKGTYKVTIGSQDTTITFN